LKLKKKSKKLDEIKVKISQNTRRISREKQEISGEKRMLEIGDYN